MSEKKNNLPPYNFSLTQQDLAMLYDAFKKMAEEENKYNKPVNIWNIKKWISPLQEVFLPDGVMNGVLMSVWLPELMEKERCRKPWVVLHGPPGTWKSVLWRALVQSFSNLGAYADELSITSLQSKWVSEYPKKLKQL